MDNKKLIDYEKDLYGCRFCPMCKPACEVGNLTKQESHSTKGRALLLWRVAAGHASFNKRDAEIIYQSTLDTISQAWCIHNYPVGDYTLAARRELVKEGILPITVRNVLESLPSPTEAPDSPSVILVETTIESDDVIALLDDSPEIWVTSTGRIPYVLGDIESAEEIAKEVADKISKAGIKKLYVDGPTGIYTFSTLYKKLGVSLPEGLEIVPLSVSLEDAFKEGKIVSVIQGGQSCFIHDSRTAFYLAEESANDSILQPALSNIEKGSGQGEIFDRPRRIVEAIGLSRTESVWAKCLSRSSGADDALDLTFPKLSIGLARVRIDQINAIGADVIICESLSDSRSLSLASDKDDDPDIIWLPNLFVKKD